MRENMESNTESNDNQITAYKTLIYQDESWQNIIVDGNYTGQDRFMQIIYEIIIINNSDNIINKLSVHDSLTYLLLLEMGVLVEVDSIHDNIIGNKKNCTFIKGNLLDKKSYLPPNSVSKFLVKYMFKSVVDWNNYKKALNVIQTICSTMTITGKDDDRFIKPITLILSLFNFK